MSKIFCIHNKDPCSRISITPTLYSYNSGKSGNFHLSKLSLVSQIFRGRTNCTYLTQTRQMNGKPSIFESRGCVFENHAGGAEIIGINA